MPLDNDRDSSPSASAVDAATLSAHQLARAAALAHDNLMSAEASTKPRHARSWRIAGFSALQECRVLVRRAMLQLASANGSDLPLDSENGCTVELAAVLRELDAFADREATLTGNDAVRRAAAMLIAKMNGGAT
jgi:hypothetical protein